MARYVMLIPNLSYDVKTNKAAKIDGLPIMLQSMVKSRSRHELKKIHKVIMIRINFSQFIPTDTPLKTIQGVNEIKTTLQIFFLLQHNDNEKANSTYNCFHNVHHRLCQYNCKKVFHWHTSKFHHSNKMIDTIFQQDPHLIRKIPICFKKWKTTWHGF